MLSAMMASTWGSRLRALAWATVNSAEKPG